MRILKEYSVNKGDGSLDAKTYREIACTSGEMAGIDTSNLADGSRLTATDTGASYVFNESAKTWTQESSGGGSGGGGGGFKVTITLTSATAGTSDKTSDEILTAAVNGSVPYAVLIAGGNVEGVVPLIMAADEAMFGYERVSSSKVTQTIVVVDSNGDATVNQSTFSGGSGE